jgi:hypothetical protein
MKKAPSRYTLKQVCNWSEKGFAAVSRYGEEWVPTRPEGFGSIGSRFKLAWMVFTGKADVLVWPKDQ